jgi:deoxyribose-phosphate aldolase
MDHSYREIAKLIDHALLSPNLRVDELEQGCQLALVYDVASVCVLPYYLRRTADLLAGSSVSPSTVIGFPHGGQATSVKQFEAERALADGGQELDMVVNISQVVSERWSNVQNDIACVVNVVHAAGQKVKVIFENCYLQDEQKIRLCQICSELNVDWVKTSTGFGPSGASVGDVRLMRQNASPRVQIKASGGVRDLDSLLRFRELGATRIGTSRTREILDDHRRRLQLAPISVGAPPTGSCGGY